MSRASLALSSISNILTSPRAIVVEEGMDGRRPLIRVGTDVDIPLVGAIAFGIIDRGTNVLQIRPTSLCPLSCPFCSTDAGPSSRRRAAEYMVDLDLLLDWAAQLVRFKGSKGIEAHVDTVGEPATYPHIVELVQGLADIPGVEIISMQTNGVLMDEQIVDELEAAGLARINLSIHALDPGLAKQLAGTDNYDLEAVLSLAEAIAASRIDLLIAPVWVPGLNDDEIPRIIEFAKGIGAGKRWPPLGIQKYLAHKRGRRPRGVRPMSWRAFYRVLRALEKRHGVKLVLSPEDFGMFKAPLLPPPFSPGEVVKVKVMAPGWLKGEVTGVARGRAITLVGASDLKPGMNVLARVIKVKHTIYLAKPL